MPRVSALTLQTLWDCRWSRPATAARKGPPYVARPEPGTQWVCIRTRGRRAITEAECEQCEHWEAADNIDDRDERG